MKQIFLFLLLILSQKFFSQVPETFSTIDSQEAIATSNNKTNINLFNIELKDLKIPISLTYNHNGIKPAEKLGILGHGWQLNNIGFINRVVQDELDNNPTTGWFNSIINDLQGYSYYENCGSECRNVPTGFNGQDLAPDFFSVNIPDNPSFDFLYKKNITQNVIGTPIPVLLSNNFNYKINTSFNEFISNNEFINNPEGITNNNTVFNIIDSRGNNFDFINGPRLSDTHRSSITNVRNNFYLKRIYNSNSPNEIVNIDYIKKEFIKEDRYNLGFNTRYLNPINQQQVLQNTLFENNEVKHLKEDYFFVDESENIISQIRSNNLTVNFMYFQNAGGLDGLLDEINVFDKNNIYVEGYKFHYNNQDEVLLWKIEKFDKNKTNTQSLYEFEYNEGRQITSETFIYAKDCFGYYNDAIYNRTLIPFYCSTSPYNLQGDRTNYAAADVTPNFEAIKRHSLSKITNRYSGQIEFDYILNSENYSSGIVYGGGLLIASKKTTPIIGKTKYIKYDYIQLMGMVIDFNSLGHHYATNYQNIVKFMDDKPTLDEFHQDLHNGFSTGNYFKYISESTYNFDDMSLLEITSRIYETNPEGIFKQPILKEESFYNNNNELVKSIEYNYDQRTIEVIPYYKYSKQFRSGSSIEINEYGQSYVDTFLRTIQSLGSYIFPVMRNVLKEKIVKTKIGGNELLEKEELEYVNNLDKRIRKVKNYNSNNILFEKKFSYSTDIASTDLILKNIVGIPLITETNKTIGGVNNLLSTEKVIYKDWGNGSLAPEFIKVAKGNLPFENKLKFTLVDSTTGNPLEIQNENGSYTSIIWGYNNTQPIAKIENAPYSAVQSYVSNLQALSNGTNENALITALNALRASLPNAIVTTTTYKPFVGISTATDQNGNQTTYLYDAFNRLKQVKDHQGNILSENEYHYKN